MTEFKRILILLENPSGTEREFLNGISRYARQSNKKWHLINTSPSDLNVLKSLSSWNAHGAIGVASTLKTAEAAKNLSFPFVNLSTRRILKNSIQIGPDHRALGQVAAEYLTDLGFRNLAFITPADTSISDLRLEGFQKTISEQNLSLHTVHVSERPMEDPAEDFEHFISSCLEQHEWQDQLYMKDHILGIAIRLHQELASAEE